MGSMDFRLPNRQPVKDFDGYPSRAYTYDPGDAETIEGERVGRWKTMIWSAVGAGAAIIAGSFARRKYEESVLEIGHEFKTGEIVSREGGYQCMQCGYVLSLAAGKRLPPCPKCSHVHYLKIS